MPSHLFKALPTVFFRMEEATKRIQRSGPEVPSLESIPVLAQRLRLLFNASKVTDYSLVTQKDFACLPYALWVEGHAFLEVEHPELMRRYWADCLPRALAQEQGGQSAWLLPLVYTYIENFSLADSNFQRFAAQLLSGVSRCQHPTAKAWMLAQAKYQWLTPSSAAIGLARHFFFNKDRELSSLIAEMYLSSEFINSALGYAVLDEALRLPIDEQRSQIFSLHVLNWLEQSKIDVVALPRWRVSVAEGLLSPWAGVAVPSKASQPIFEFFEQRYGVVPELHQKDLFAGDAGPWRGISDKALSVMRYWQMGDLIRLFMRLIRDTADDTWRYREKFWMAYYDHGVIDDVRLILGPDAAALAKNLKSGLISKTFSLLIKPPKRNQSVIVIKVGDLVLVEGSHDRSLRAILEPEHAMMTRKFLRNAHIQSSDLMINSLDFHDGKNARPELQHQSSTTGWWQRKTRDLIKKYTGVSLPDWEIL